MNSQHFSDWDARDASLEPHERLFEELMRGEEDNLWAIFFEDNIQNGKIEDYLAYQLEAEDEVLMSMLYKWCEGYCTELQSEYLDDFE